MLILKKKKKRKDKQTIKMNALYLNLFHIQTQKGGQQKIGK